MSNAPRVSIVLPTYNGTRYLAQAIESCLTQTYRDWELIIVDDHSSDQTPQIIDQFVQRDSRIHCIRNEINRKLPASLNVGFAQARGEYLTWTSDDNLYRPTALERMVAALSNHPEIGLVYTDYSVIDEAGNFVRGAAVSPASALAYVNCIGASFLYRRTAREAAGDYATDMYLAEDYDYWVRIARHYPLLPLREDLYLYRLHAGSLTSNYAERVAAATERVLHRHLPAMTWASRDARAQGYLLLARRARIRGDYRMCWQYGIRAVANAPLGCAREIWGTMVHLLGKKIAGAVVIRKGES